MNCFNCETNIVGNEGALCPNCNATINSTKYNFISYIGSPDSLAGYQKSYKLLLLKYIIECIIEGTEASVFNVISRIKEFYVERAQRGLSPDYDVDSRIAQIDTSSDYDIFAVIKSQPFKVINEKGYLYLNRNDCNKLVFVFNDDIATSMSVQEWTKLLKIINAKLSLYYDRYDGAITEKPENSEELQVEEKETSERTSINPALSVLDIENLSVRAKNVLMRNQLYTIGDVISFVEDNDLLSLKNMGQKTCEEILELIHSSNAVVAFDEENSTIAVAFRDNGYRLFVEYCNKHGIEKLSDLRGFDFSVLLNESGFGVGKLSAIRARYEKILARGESLSGEFVIEDQMPEEPQILIDKSNMELGIPYLKFAGVSAKNNARFYEKGFSKIGQLSAITLNQLTQMFGKAMGQKYFDGIKLFEKPLIRIATDRLNEHKGTREFDIYIDRANKKTLQEIADKYGLTRERVRQIEAKFFREFSPLFGSLVKQHMAQNALTYILTQDILEFFDDDEFDTVIMYTLKETSYLEYLSFADVFIRKEDESQDTYAKLYALTAELIGEDGINFFDSLPQIEEMLNNSGLDFISTEAYLGYLIEINARFYGDFVYLKKQPYAKLCLMLINKYFKDGINVYSDEEINQLRAYFQDEFGDYELPEQNRAISARLLDYLVTCDRGKAKTIENIHFEQSVIEDIKAYIDASELKTLYFSEIYNEFEGILTFTSDIVNYHGLHGVLSLLYRDEYEFTIDSITKKNCEATTLTLSERIVNFINERGTFVSKNEIKQKIGGLSDIMLVNAVSNSKTLLQWDYNSFNTIDNLHISDDDVDALRDCLEEMLDTHSGYCSDRLIYNKLLKEKPAFIEVNKIENATNLFYVLQKILGGQYQFSRPHICRQGLVDSPNTKTIALHLLGETTQISRRDFVRIAKDVLWSETTADLIFYELEKDYIRLSDDLYTVADNFYVEEEALTAVKKHLHSLIEPDTYLSMIGFNDFVAFPNVGYEWNSFLLVSIIKTYGLGFKLVSPAIKDRRYNKEIIVQQESEWNHLEDIVHALLVKNNISVMDESNLLSFLVIHHLIAKIIPKELYDAQKLNYVDGYFNIK